MDVKGTITELKSIRDTLVENPDRYLEVRDMMNELIDYLENNQ